jgi:hypothetical protein
MIGYRGFYLFSLITSLYLAPKVSTHILRRKTLKVRHDWNKTYPELNQA